MLSIPLGLPGLSTILWRDSIRGKPYQLLHFFAGARRNLQLKTVSG
jgi:hypothetical protein